MSKKDILWIVSALWIAASSPASAATQTETFSNSEKVSLLLDTENTHPYDTADFSPSFLNSTGLSDQSEIALLIKNTPVITTLVADRIVREMSETWEIDVDSLSMILSPEVIGWDMRTINGQIMADKLDEAYKNESLDLHEVTLLLEESLRLWNQGSNPESRDTVIHQVRNASGKFASSLNIESLLRGNNGAELAEAMYQSNTSWSLEEVMISMWLNIDDYEYLYNVFGSWNNPDWINGGIKISTDIAAQLDVVNAIVTKNWDVVLMARSCGWNVTYLPKSAESILILEQIITQSQENVQPTYRNINWQPIISTWTPTPVSYTPNGPATPSIPWIPTTPQNPGTPGTPWTPLFPMPPIGPLFPPTPPTTGGNPNGPGPGPGFPSPVPGIPAWLALWSWLLALLTLRKKTKKTDTLVRN